MEGSVIGSKRLTPTRVGKMASKCLFVCYQSDKYVFKVSMAIILGSIDMSGRFFTKAIKLTS